MQENFNNQIPYFASYDGMSSNWQKVDCVLFVIIKQRCYCKNLRL